MNVLIVEDEPLLVMDVEAMVEDAGHVVIGEAGSLREVEALDIDREPDLVFVDMQLAQGSSGLDVSAHVQRRWRDAIIIFVTANPRMIPQDFAGAHGVIAKPFSQSSFMSAIHYLEQGMIAPPPSVKRPSAFVAAKSLLDGWGVGA